LKPLQPPPRISSSSQQRMDHQRSSRSRAIYRGNNNNNNNETLVYVHPVSRMVLLHFQTLHHEWIERQHLHQRLFILHPNGTFLLESNHSHYQSVVRLWTYQQEDRTHWLAMSKHDVMHRFLLYDESVMVWNDRCQYGGMQEQVTNSIQELMDSIDANI
jgi:hypothetical protein